ncbi:hypothetical protein ACJ72_05987 [Emergomyces africanus]|uniref:Sucrase/ferredoxin-like family protein n=1 Tax=Emergomyces africanus TaxID=1955775 RepID=A0A1B7NSB7_9EURO|nr:hypothetical protein ACJ72_05987 [Emergomyces africanus]
MQALLRRGASILTPRTNSPASDGKANTASEDTLFTKVNPALDGEDCDLDCSSCTIRYPSKFDIDTEDKLYGHVKGWATHLLIATGKTDWVRDVADEKGSVMEAIEKGGLVPSNGPMKLSASNIPVPDEYHHHEVGKQPTTALILPAFIFVDHVTPALASDLITYFVNPSVTTTSPLNTTTHLDDRPGTNTYTPETASENSSPPRPLSPQTATDPSVGHASLTSLRSRPCQHSAVILLCSQRTRDARCGQSAPLLRREFERHLRPRGLYRDLGDERPGGVGIYFISHVGGHKYSANVIVYRRRNHDYSGAATETDRASLEEGAAQGIWLARVRPEDCEGIVKFTVLQGKVIKPESQLRGGFDREKGLVSW